MPIGITKRPTANEDDDPQPQPPATAAKPAQAYKDAELRAELDKKDLSDKRARALVKRFIAERTCRPAQITVTLSAAGLGVDEPHQTLTWRGVPVFPPIPRDIAPRTATASSAIAWRVASRRRSRANDGFRPTSMGGRQPLDRTHPSLTVVSNPRRTDSAGVQFLPL